MNLATKRFLALMLLWLLICHLAANELTGVRAVDEGRGASKVTLTLSESSPYRVSVSDDKKSFQVMFSGVKNLATIPDYKRLSPVIDRIISRNENGNAVVEIRTMQGCNYTEYKVGRRVYLELEFIKKPAPKAKVARRRAVRPKAEVVVEKPDSVCIVVPDSLIMTAPQDSVSQVEPPQSEVARVRHSREWYSLMQDTEFWLIIAGAVLALLLVFWLLFIRGKKPEQFDFEVVSDAKRSAPEPEEDVNPVLSKMAQKLADQGWTAEEIAAELNIPEAAAKRLIERGEE
ncbi:MAG TPA: hypothetical protein PL126_01140 [Candidatus Cloacimonadota bacterium]|nr:hypothetical protein [Candidatus Cloacimonadota bacterium]